MLHLLFPWLISFKAKCFNSSSNVLFCSLRAENYSHTNPTLLKSQLSLAAGSGKEKHVVHLVELEKSYE